MATDLMGNPIEAGDLIVTIFKPYQKRHKLLYTEATKVSGERVYFNVPRNEARYGQTEEYTTSDRVMSITGMGWKSE